MPSYALPPLWNLHNPRRSYESPTTDRRSVIAFARRWREMKIRARRSSAPDALQNSH
jgi:hypothetical protein